MGSAKCGTLALVPRRGVLEAEADGRLPLPSLADGASCRPDAGLTVRASRGVVGHAARGVASPPARALCCWCWPLGGDVCRLPRVMRTRAREGLSEGRPRRAGGGQARASASGARPGTTTNARAGRTGARRRSRAASTRTHIVSSISRISLSRTSIPFSPSSALPRTAGRRPRPHTFSERARAKTRRSRRAQTPVARRRCRYASQHCTHL